jgi:hypothetical protein
VHHLHLIVVPNCVSNVGPSPFGRSYLLQKRAMKPNDPRVAPGRNSTQWRNRLSNCRTVIPTCAEAFETSRSPKLRISNSIGCRRDSSSAMGEQLSDSMHARGKNSPAASLLPDKRPEHRTGFESPIRQFIRGEAEKPIDARRPEVNAEHFKLSIDDQSRSAMRGRTAQNCYRRKLRFPVL